MEIGNVEISNLKNTSEAAFEFSNKELAELQLASAGCGAGDVFVG
jgi:hypothetical protein